MSDVPRPRLSTDIRRFRFMEAIKKNVPEVLQALEKEVLPAFRAMFTVKRIPGDKFDTGETAYMIDRPASANNALEHVCIKWRDQHSLSEGMRRIPAWAAEFGSDLAEPSRVAFRDSALRWASRWNLTDEWILNWVLESLLSWLQKPADRSLAWKLSGDATILPADVAAVPKLQVIDPWLFEPWEIFERRVQKSLSNYRREVTAFSRSMGYDPEESGNSLHHYEWLALFQCRGLSAGRILIWHGKYHKENVHETAITHAINSTARHIGLTKRPGHCQPQRKR